MKLLLLGSLLVVFGLVAWAAMDWAIYRGGAAPSPGKPPVPVIRFVVVPRDQDGRSPPNAIIWQTSTAVEDCADVLHRRNREEKKRIADLLSPGGSFPLNRESGNPCAPFQLGEVEEGTRVEILDACGKMERVRILSGSLQGREGCIETGHLTEGRS